MEGERLRTALADRYRIERELGEGGGTWSPSGRCCSAFSPCRSWVSCCSGSFSSITTT